jgi:hypothetical protein
MGDDDRTRDPDPDETAEDASPDEEFVYSDSFDAEQESEDGEESEDDGAPPLPEPVTVAVTGVLCGFVMVGFVWLAERGCDVARGTPNCGGWGLPLLLLTVATTVLAGLVMLRRLRYPSPALTSFLGVCFMLIVVVGALSNRLFTPWSILVLPALTAGTFLFARAVVARLNANR